MTDRFPFWECTRVPSHDRRVTMGDNSRGGALRSKNRSGQLSMVLPSHYDTMPRVKMRLGVQSGLVVREHHRRVGDGK